MIERPDGTYTTLKATERILIAKMDQPGAYEVLYNVGDPIRLEDAIALGLYSPSGQPTAQQMVAAVKTGPEPRENEKTEGKASEADRKVPRDKAMRGPREKKEKPDG